MNKRTHSKYWKYILLSIALIGILVFHDIGHAQDTPLTIFLETPSAGETYYAAPSTLCYSVNIKGWVTSSVYPFNDVQITLEIIQDNKVVKTLTSVPDAYGEFTFPITVNPEGSDGWFTPVEVELNCEDCHYRTVHNLPAGDFIVRATATTPDGTSASDVRHARVDLSAYATIPVQVVLKGEPETRLKDVPVTATTWLYLWRTRVVEGLTNDKGVAELRVEALSLVPTEYQLFVEPSVVDGYLYEGTERIDVVLEPGAVSGPLTTIEVNRKAGKIVGQFTYGGKPLPIDVTIWLVHLPDASATKTQVNGGSFILPEVAIDNYLITADAKILAEAGYKLIDQQIDLRESIDASIELPLSKINSGRLRARIYDEGNNLLPFAWITVQENGIVHQIAPGSDSLDIFDLSNEDQIVIASAPGFYSQAAVHRPGQDEVDEFHLVINPETLIIPWGEGKIFLPPESGYVVNDLDIELERGWMWAEGNGEDPVNIRLPGIEISIEKGKFAVENVPGKMPWFYLWEGIASIQSLKTGETIDVGQNQMVALSEKGKLTPVAMDPVVTAAFHANKSRPFGHTWQPELRAQIRDRLALLGIGTAQLITLITYLLVFISILFIPCYWIYSSYRKRRIQN